MDDRIIDQLESFGKTIVGDYFEIRKDAFDWVKDSGVALLRRPEHVREQVMAQVECITKGNSNDLDIKERGEKRNYPFCETFDLWQAASMHRRFFISHNKYMGLAPAEALVGDLICILFGTNRPAILRQIGDYYIFIGAAYFHGWSKGNAVEELFEKGEVRVQDFYIH